MYLKLFLTFFKIGLFGFGGGYSILSFIQKEVIEVNGWLTTSEFIDMLAIAQITPGPIVINTATFVGYQMLGIKGAIIATIAVVLPSLIIIVLISIFLNKFKESAIVKRIFKGLRPITLGLILSAAIQISSGVFIDFKSIIISIGIFYLLIFKQVGSIKLIILSGVIGVLLY